MLLKLFSVTGDLHMIIMVTSIRISHSSRMVVSVVFSLASNLKRNGNFLEGLDAFAELHDGIFMGN